jgi:hypothetical protein
VTTSRKNPTASRTKRKNNSSAGARRRRTRTAVIPVAVETTGTSSRKQAPPRQNEALATDLAVIPVAVETGPKLRKTRARNSRVQPPATDVAVIPVAIQSQPQQSSKPARRAKSAKRERTPKRTNSVALKKTDRHRKPPDLFTTVVDQATRVQEHAVDVAAQFSFAGIDVLQTATALLLAPTVLLGAPAKPDDIKLLPWSPPTSLESRAVPLPSSIAA